jgi:hypothetical protein
MATLAHPAKTGNTCKSETEQKYILFHTTVLSTGPPIVLSYKMALHALRIAHAMRAPLLLPGVWNDTNN